MTGHASQVWAMNAMLADFRDGTLTLLGGIDTSVWSDLVFEDIHTEGGLAVSLRLEAGKVTHLSIQSSTGEPHSVILCIPPLSVQQELTIPSENSELAKQLPLALSHNR